ncbi:MAG: ABC transporter substrate-binding protein [Bradyrhizobium sp.]|nr:ABC transporter substrate-binding protein [Bradyrhizobium sp.]
MAVTTRAIFVAVIALFAWPQGAVAQMKVIISGGFSGAYEQLLPEFEKTTGIKVTTGSGASQGDGPQTIAAQLARGEKADVVILSREGLDGLIAAHRIVIGTDVDLATVGVGVGIRPGTAKPDLSTVDAVKRTLLNARLVTIPQSTSGIWLMKELFPRLGIADKIHVKPMARGAAASGMVASGEADLTVLPVSEVVHDKGVELAGVFPMEIQFMQTFSAAVVAGSNEAQAGKRLIEFLSSARASEAIRSSGLEPGAAR